MCGHWKLVLTLKVKWHAGWNIKLKGSLISFWMIVIRFHFHLDFRAPTNWTSITQMSKELNFMDKTDKKSPPPHHHQPKTNVRKIQMWIQILPFLRLFPVFTNSRQEEDGFKPSSLTWEPNEILVNSYRIRTLFTTCFSLDNKPHD